MLHKQILKGVPAFHSLPRSCHAVIAADLKSSSTSSVLVDESLPYGQDSDPTIPMDLSSGVTASVEGMIARGEQADAAQLPEVETKDQEVREKGTT